MCGVRAVEKWCLLVVHVALRVSAAAAWEAGFVFLLFCASRNAEFLWPAVGVGVKTFSTLSSWATRPDMPLRLAGLRVSRAPNF